MANPFFIQRLRESMEQERDLDNAAANWQTIENQLDTTPRRGFVFRWWMVLPLLLLLVIGGWQWIIFKNTQELVRKIEEQSIQNTLISDTIVQKVIVYDTIYRTIIIEKQKEEGSPIKMSSPMEKATKKQPKKGQNNSVSFLKNRFRNELPLVSSSSKARLISPQEKGKENLISIKTVHPIQNSNWQWSVIPTFDYSGTSISNTLLLPLLEFDFFYEKEKKEDGNVIGSIFKNMNDLQDENRAIVVLKQEWNDQTKNMDNFQNLSNWSLSSPITNFGSEMSKQSVLYPSSFETTTYQVIAAHLHFQYYFPSKRWQPFVGFSGAGNWQWHKNNLVLSPEFGFSELAFANFNPEIGMTTVDFRNTQRGGNLPELPTLPQMNSIVERHTFIVNQQSFFDWLYQVNLGINFNF